MPLSAYSTVDLIRYGRKMYTLGIASHSELAHDIVRELQARGILPSPERLPNIKVTVTLVPKDG